MELKSPNERVRGLYAGFQLSMWQLRHQSILLLSRCQRNLILIVSGYKTLCKT